MNKALRGIWNKCPYLSEAEMERIWTQARIMYTKQTRGPVNWGAITLIARNMAQKLDEERLKADEAQWKAKQKQ